MKEHSCFSRQGMMVAGAAVEEVAWGTSDDTACDVVNGMVGTEGRFWASDAGGGAAGGARSRAMVEEGEAGAGAGSCNSRPEPPPSGSRVPAALSTMLPVTRQFKIIYIFKIK